MTQPATAAECIRTPIVLKPPKPKEKPCPCCWWWHVEKAKTK